MHPILKRVLHLIGSVIAIIGIAFVVLRLSEYSSDINFAQYGINVWMAVSAFALIYGLANLTLALAWWNLLKQFGANTELIWAIKVYGISQIAKYVPGNIFHLAGRQVMGISAGFGGWSLAKTAIWELVLMASVGGLYTILIIPLIYSQLDTNFSIYFFIAIAAVVGWLLNKIFNRKILIAYLLYLTFLMIAGVVFSGIVTLISTSTYGINYVYVAAAFVVAWLAGLVTPGAPAGIGVRELVLLFLLKGIVTDADVLLAVVIGRLVTVVGDLFFYLYALTIKIKTVVIE